MPGQDSRSHWAISLFPAGMRSTRGKRKDEEGKRTKERREDQGGKKRSLNGGDLRGGTPGSETSKAVRAWALAAVGSGDHPRPERAGGRAPPDALERVGGAGARKFWAVGCERPSLSLSELLPRARGEGEAQG